MAQALIVIITAISVAMADALTKKVANDAPTFMQGVFHWMITPIVALYLVQIVLFIYLFQSKWQLGRLCILQMTIIGICVTLIGWLYFGDKIQLVHALGMAISLAGVVLMNW